MRAQNEIEKEKRDTHFCELHGTVGEKNREDSSTRIGVILGTGTNAAYVERVKNLKTTHGLPLDDVVVINTEWGGFGSGQPGTLPLTQVDVDIDRASPNPGEQWFEKLIVGFFVVACLHGRQNERDSNGEAKLVWTLPWRNISPNDRKACGSQGVVG